MKTPTNIALRTLAFITLALSTTAGVAQSKDPCATQQNTMEINECGKLTLAKEDKKLTLAYQKLLKTFVPVDKIDNTDYQEAKRLLIEAQRSWIKFRDNDCNGQFILNANGTIRGAVYYGCLIERTEQRTKELLKWTEN
jgi:uncharacterized protein YecT (DUF1311 family)